MPKRASPYARYKIGRKRIYQLGEFFERLGFAWTRSRRSRGCGDLFVWSGEHRYLIKVKTSERADRTLHASCLSPNERQNLLVAAKRISAAPLLALVVSERVKLYTLTGDLPAVVAGLLPLERRYREAQWPIADGADSPFISQRSAQELRGAA